MVLDATHLAPIFGAMIDVHRDWLLLFVVVSALPFIVWLMLYATSRRWPVHVLGFLRPLRIMRWIGWFVGVALFVLHLGNDKFPALYGLLGFSFSTGLSFPESWIRRRFCPDPPVLGLLTAGGRPNSINK